MIVRDPAAATHLATAAPPQASPPSPRAAVRKDTAASPWLLCLHFPVALLAGSTTMSSPIQCGSRTATEAMLAGSHAGPPHGQPPAHTSSPVLAVPPPMAEQSEIQR